MTELAALVRFLHLAASVLLVGRFGFSCLILRANAQSLNGASVPAGHESLFRSITAVALIIAWVTHLSALWLQLLSIRDPSAGVLDINALASFVAATRYGNVWLARSLLLGILSVVCCRVRHGNQDATLIPLLLSSGQLMLLAWSGHSAATAAGIVAFETIADALHLLFAALWLGGLPFLALVLWLHHRESRESNFSIIRNTVQRFSGWALMSVTVLIATGTLNAWTLIGGFSQLFGTPYGNLLLWKLILLLPLLVVAAHNRWRIKPSFAREAESKTHDLTADVKRLQRNVIIETMIGVSILFIVGHMSVTPPARHVQPDWPFAIRWDWSILEKAPKARAEAQRAAVWAFVGGAALLAALVRRRRRLLSAFVGVALLAYAGYVTYPLITIDAYPATYKRPAVSYNAISVANGSTLYQESGCISCHGPNGYGDGPNAQELDPKPADLTAPHANAHTAGDLYWWLSYGVKATSAMPGFSASLSEEERWDLINYLRALATGERARDLAPIIEEKPWLVAPDFAYATNTGEAKTLRDHRGNKIVLLIVLNLQETEQRLRELEELAPRLLQAGVEIVIIPDLIDRLFVANKLPGLIVDEGIREIRETYKLFAASFSAEGSSGPMPHVEYLIDKQGYIRARWLPAENAGWRKFELLMQQIEALQKEKPSAPAPDEHVH